MNRRRNITVYSETLAAFTIDHGESRSMGPDLLVSYHDNDHYNSVRNKLYPPKPSRIKPPSPMNDHTNIQIKNIENTHQESEIENVTASLSKLPINEPEEKEIKTKKTLKRSAPCPCGSGLRYKRCCLAKQKHATRMERLKAESQCDEGDLSGSDEGETLLSPGIFRVVSI